MTSPESVHQPTPGTGETTEESPKGDTALIVGVIRRRPKALADIFERYSGDVHAQALRSAGPDLATAVVRQVFDELWQSPQMYETGSGSLRAHLLHRTLVWARDGRGPPDGERDIRSLEPIPDLSVILAPLSPHQREAIVLARRTGYTYREVAAVLDRSESVVKRDIRQGLTRLYEQMTATRNDEN